LVPAARHRASDTEACGETSAENASYDGHRDHRSIQGQHYIGLHGLVRKISILVEYRLGKQRCILRVACSTN